MSQRQIVMLGVATLILMLLALLFSGQRSGGLEEGSGLLVPGLREQVNELTALDIRGADGSLIVALRRDAQLWRVDNRDGFEADFRRVHDFLRELATARRAEPRTAQPEWHARLGLAEIGSPEASGVLIEFPGTELPAVILGQQDAITGGRFARLERDDSTWLSDRPLAVAVAALNWLERSVMDIPASELAEVRIEHADGDRVHLRPADEAGDQWVLLNVPTGREAGPRWEIRPVANGLANIQLDEVRRHDGAVPDDAVRSTYITRDGLVFAVRLFSDENGSWAHFSVSVQSGEEVSGDRPKDQLLIDATAVDARLSPWQFALNPRKFEVMTARQESLLAAPAS
ncbi:MAG: DUF4340 domain-containing protein [Wenzhouxiangella sp.]